MGMSVSQVKITELSRLTAASKATISNFFRDKKQFVTTANNRVTGISAAGVQEFLSEKNMYRYNQSAIILAANLCGGVGKTSSIYNIGACARRIVPPSMPIVFVDSDSQGSLTCMEYGIPASDNEPVLIDYLEKKVSIKDILSPLGQNTWFVKSNLNQAWADKVLSKPQDIKNGMKEFYQDIFKELGGQAQIYQDHGPQLSSTFASSVAATSQMDDDILKSLIIPLRSDSFAIQGGDCIIKEVLELQETFNLKTSLRISCFFSSIDRRISSTADAIKQARQRERILEHLSPAIIRYCAEIPKSIMEKKNVFSSGKNNNAAADYIELFQDIFNQGE